MRAPFLEKLVKKYPNHYQLGAAVKRYYDLRQTKLTKEECEKIVLSSSFSIN